MLYLSRYTVLSRLYVFYPSFHAIDIVEQLIVGKYLVIFTEIIVMLYKLPKEQKN